MKINYKTRNLLVWLVCFIGTFVGSSSLFAQTVEYYSGKVILPTNMEKSSFLHGKGRIITSGKRIVFPKGFHHKVEKGNSQYNLHLKVTEKPSTFLDVGQASSVQEDALLGIYPNPTSNNLNLTLDMLTPDAVTVQIYGMDGRAYEQLTYSEELPIGRSSIQLSVENLVAGQYAVVLNMKSGKVISRRLTKL